MKKRSNKLLAAFLVLVMVFSSAIALVPSSSNDNLEAATVTKTLGDTSTVTLKVGDTLRIRTGGTYSSEYLILGAMNIPWMNYVPQKDGSNWFVSGTAEVGSYRFSTGSAIDFDVNVYIDVTFSITGSEVTQRFFSSNVSLYSPGTQTEYVLRYYTSSTGGSLLGTAGGTATLVTSQTIYGRWEQTKVILPASTDHYYVHYRDYIEYDVNAIPPSSYITSAFWMSTTVAESLPISFSGQILRVDQAELASGTYEMSITVAASGLVSANMILYVHVYPHVYNDIDLFSLGAWSYIVSTYNNLDRMELISATLTADGTTITAPNYGSIAVDTQNRTVSYRFFVEGYYEITLRLISQTGERNTTVLRIYVIDEPPAVFPSANGIYVIPSSDPLAFDFILQNPANYSSVTWDYGDGTVETNSSTSRHHAYSISGTYTVTVTLANANGSVTLTSVVEPIAEAQPAEAKVGEMFVAVVAVNTSDIDDITVECADWMTWELMVTASGSYVKIVGTYTDTRLVGDTYQLRVLESGTLVASWPVTAVSAHQSTLQPDFVYEMVDTWTVRIKYTGTKDSGTTTSVQWVAGDGYTRYAPAADGWMYHTYSVAGSVILTVSDWTNDHEVTVSRQIVVGITLDSGPDRQDEEDDDSGPSSMFYIILAIGIVAMIAGCVLALFTGNWIVSTIVAVIGAICLVVAAAIFFGVITVGDISLPALNAIKGGRK